MEFLLPVDLDLSKLILSKPTIEIYKLNNHQGKRCFMPTTVKTKSLIKYLPYCYYLIHLITTRTKNFNRKEDGYINLNSRLINKLIPTNSRILVIDLLVKLNVIEVNHNYKIKDYSKSYRLTSNYTNQPQKSRHIEGTNIKHINDIEGLPLMSPYVSAFLRDKKIESKLILITDQKTDDLINNQIEYGFQRNQLLNIKFNHQEAKDYADYQLANGQLTKSEYDHLLTTFKAIAVGEHRMNLNNKVNRLFSIITNLKKEYRSFLRCNEGYSMFEFDFKSSHVYHLTKLIKDDIINGYIVPTDQLIKEVQLITYNLQSVGLYEYIVSKYNETHVEKIDRTEAKEMVLQRLLNGKGKGKKLTHKKTTWIRSVFPSIAGYVDQVNEKDKKTIAIRLMLSESKLLHNHIIKRIAIEAGSTVLFSVHDSLIVNQNNFDQVYNIIIVESEKFFDLDQVQIEVKDLDQIEISIPNQLGIAA